jgi:addiction module RelB/DinJ family antitoxin
MSPKTLLTVKIDPELKEQAKKTAAEFGMPLGTMVNALLRDVVRNQRVEFIAASPASLTRIQKIRKDAATGKNVRGPFTSGNDLIKDLRR